MLRLCIIGSSYIGALYKFASENPTQVPIDIDLFGSASPRFNQIDVKGGRIVKYMFANAVNGGNIHDYDVFLIYGDMVTPQRAIEVEKYLSDAPYSIQVKNQTMIDIVSDTSTIALLDKLKNETIAPIFVASSNVSVDERKISDDEFRQGALTIENFIKLRGANYFIFPRELMDDGYAGLPQYYEYSVNLRGNRGSDDASNKKFDRYHLNSNGGGIFLSSLLAEIQQSMESVSLQPSPVVFRDGEVTDS